LDQSSLFLARPSEQQERLIDKTLHDLQRSEQNITKTKETLKSEASNASIQGCLRSQDVNLIMSVLDKFKQSSHALPSRNDGKESPEFRYREYTHNNASEIESDDDSDDDRPRKVERSKDQSDSHLGKRVAIDGNHHTPRKAFDAENENDKNRYWKHYKKQNYWTSWK
jgi:hypothetical protein